MNFLEHLENQLNDIKEQGLFKEERIITSSQQPNIKVNYEHDVINLCANNYLGLANSHYL